ncbi:MAG: ABC transporter permease [Acidobacteria bacterium]|nr:ABC transporter permease [Acidobacteriota bacterium]
MRWLRRRKQREAREFERELQFHIEELRQRNLAAGMSAKEARRQAILEFGGPEQMTEQLREVHQIPILETVTANLKFGLRLLRRAPAFSMAIVLTLTLGIGANSAVFSAIDAVLLRALPFPHADELVVVRQYNYKEKSPWSFVAPVRLEDWNKSNSTFQAITGYYVENESETSLPVPEKLTHALVAPRFLQVWGVAPAIGRDFLPAEELLGGPDAALISDRLWHKRFNADPNIVGKSLHFGSAIPGHRPAAYTIVGVMSPSFFFPDRDVDLWSPVPTNAPYAQSRESTWYQCIGRLKPGVTVKKALADLSRVQSDLGRQFPKTDANLAVSLSPAKQVMVGESSRSLWILFGAVTLLLLIACTNIAALLLARMSDREQEISVRFSLGASRRAVIGQLLTETFVLALVGSIAGLTLASGAAKLFRTFTPNLPRVQEIALDWRIVGYSLFCALFVTFLCGLLPALRGTRLAGSLAKASRTQVSGRYPAQWVLVGIQMALAVTLLIGAGLLQRSLQELARVTPGFDASRVLTLQISESYGETADMKALTQRSKHILETLRGIPGVEAAANVSTLPGIPGQQQTELRILEGERDPNRKILADSRFVSPGYFDVMKIPILAGDACRDSTSPTVLVNRSFNNAYFGQSPATGHHLSLTPNSQFTMTGEIRGIAADSREQGINTEPIPTVYWCSSVAFPGTYYMMRTKADPMTLADSVRRTIHEIEPSRSVFDVQPLEQRLTDSFAEDRLRTMLLSLFALTAVSLACLGIYGTLSYFVAIRRREIGLRLALGSLRRQIALRFLTQGLSVCAIGCVCGLLLALTSVRLLSGMLYGISRFDPLTFIAVVALVLVVAAGSTLIPATRAARTDPMHVLREE